MHRAVYEVREKKDVPPVAFQAPTSPKSQTAALRGKVLDHTEQDPRYGS